MPTCTPQSAAVESLLLRGRWAGQEARANDQGRERVGKRAQGAESSCTLVNLTILCCPATTASAELAAARPQAAIIVLVKATRASRSASHPAPRGAAQLPGSFACARSTARTASPRARLSCLCGHSASACGPVGRGVPCGPVGMSDGHTELAVTFLYPTMGAGRPLGGVAAARKAVFVSTNEGDLSRKQPVNRI